MSIPTVLDRFSTPPCAKLLGLDILEAEREGGRVKVTFTALPEFCNAAGNVQGGFLAAMLDDCMGPAILIATDAAAFPSTIDLNVQFLAPAKRASSSAKVEFCRSEIPSPLSKPNWKMHLAISSPVQRQASGLRRWTKLSPDPSTK